MDLPLPANTTATRAAFAPWIGLAKPGIVVGNAVALAGGYFLGDRDGFDPVAFAGVLTGLSLVVASAGAVNNVVDRDIDQLMERTRERTMARGDLGVPEALLGAGFAGLVGFALLGWASNALAVLAAAVGYAVYVLPYTLWLKRGSVHGTLVGSVSGAMPPLTGYLAATGAFDSTALLLALAFGFWQMPHSWAIGLFRGRDYRAAGIPLLPVLRGARAAKKAMLAYTAAFAASVAALSLTGPVGPFFWAPSCAVTAAWLAQVAWGFRARDDEAWARGVFFTSLVVVLVLGVSLGVDGALHP